MERKDGLKIFLADDSFCGYIYEQHLQNLGYSNVSVFNNAANCLANLREQPNIVFLGHGAGDNSLELVKQIKRFNPDIYVVYLVNTEDIDTAGMSLIYGAFDYIVKGDTEVNSIQLVIQRIQNINKTLHSSTINFINTLS